MFFTWSTRFNEKQLWIWVDNAEKLIGLDRSYSRDDCAREVFAADTWLILPAATCSDKKLSRARSTHIWTYLKSWNSNFGVSKRNFGILYTVRRVIFSSSFLEWNLRRILKTWEVIPRRALLPNRPRSLPCSHLCPSRAGRKWHLNLCARRSMTDIANMIQWSILLSNADDSGVTLFYSIYGENPCFWRCGRVSM